MSEVLSLSKFQRILLFLIIVSLSVLLFIFKAQLRNNNPLDQLARKSIEPEIALSNKKTSIFEFYADWCEVCKEMSITMNDLEVKYSNDLNLVLLNIDNPKWEDLIEKYEVQGVPHFEFFNYNGNSVGRTIGFKSSKDMNSLVNSLINKEDINFNFSNNIYSKINQEDIDKLRLEKENKIISPTSHG